MKAPMMDLCSKITSKSNCAERVKEQNAKEDKKIKFSFSFISSLER